MLSLDDSRWSSLTGGYRVPIDVRPLLRQLEAAPDPRSAWEALWNELHHQGDVGLASFAAVPHLVNIHQVRGAVDWNTYALVATIEFARGVGGNPDVPAWGRADYESALRRLAEIGLVELPRAKDETATRAILSVLAIAFGARAHGRVLLEFDRDEILELEREAFGESGATDATNG
jgi:hypothetical protein